MYTKDIHVKNGCPCFILFRSVLFRSVLFALLEQVSFESYEFFLPLSFLRVKNFTQELMTHNPKQAITMEIQNGVGHVNLLLELVIFSLKVSFNLPKKQK